MPIRWIRGGLTVGKSTPPAPFVEAPPATWSAQTIETQGKPSWPLTCFRCCVTPVPPSSLPLAPLGQVQAGAPAALPDSRGRAFQSELEGAACESPESAPAGLRHPARKTAVRSTAEPRREEAEPGGDARPDSRETAGPSPGSTEAPRTAPATAQTAGQGQAAAPAKTEGACTPSERASPEVVQESARPARPSEPATQSSGQANVPVLERASLPAGLAKDIAFAVKCSDAGRQDSAGAGDPQPQSGSAERAQPANSGALPGKLAGATPKTEEKAAKANGISGKQGTPQAGGGPGSAGAEKGSISVAGPSPSPAAQAASNGPASVPALRGAPESGTVQSPATALEPGAVRSTGRIDLQVHGQQSERVDVRLVARGNEVQVTVKTASAGLTTDLRDGLQDLVQTLKDSGFQTEAWRPIQHGSPTSSANNHSGAEQEQTAGSGKGGGESSSGWQQENRGGRGREDNPPRWAEELEASLTSPPKTKWRELSWQR